VATANVLAAAVGILCSLDDVVALLNPFLG
jgi:hypothetical protein